MRLLDLVIRMAPLGIACLVFSLTARLGFDVMRQLGAYVAVVLLGLGIQQFVVYSARSGGSAACGRRRSSAVCAKRW
jgi:DAACS family dicarboxylate/amino acid:cation (Na+ or H+) symporter